MDSDSCKALEPPTVQKWQQLPNFYSRIVYTKHNMQVSSVTTEFLSLLKKQHYHVYPIKILKTLYFIKKYVYLKLLYCYL